MKKQYISLILTLILTVLLAMPVFANDVSVSTGRSATSLKPNSSSAESSDLKQSTTKTGSVLNTVPSTNSSSVDKNTTTTSLTDSQTTTTQNAPSNSNNVSVSSSSLPKAGLSPVIGFAIVGIVVLSSFLYNKVIKYNL